MKPFLPFTRPSIDPDSIAAVADVFRSGQLASGPKVLAFEAALSAYIGGDRHVRVMTSATEGLEIALAVAGIGPGHEVIVPAMSFAASANVVARVGATPVFVDIELQSRNIDLTRVEAAITPRTRAIMPVHFSGLAVDMDGLYGLAEKHGLRVVEDAAHAIGSRYRGKPIGSFGDLVVFSFHPNKNMTTIEGGAIATRDPKEAEAIEIQRFHGIKRNAAGEVDVFMPGAKANLSDVAAQIGIDQLRRLDGFNARRRHLAGLYFQELRSGGIKGAPAAPAVESEGGAGRRSAGVAGSGYEAVKPRGADAELGRAGVVLPARGDDGHSWHMFQLLIDFAALGTTRPAFQKAMAERGIGIGVHYPCIPGLAYYRAQGHRPEDFPVAERVGRETVTLPLFPAMSDEDVVRVCAELRAELGKAQTHRPVPKATVA